MGTEGLPDREERLLGRWGHSFEEDREGVTVYRPAGFPFPLARGRDGIEFRPDGSFIRWAIGRGDASEARPGRWRYRDDGSLEMTIETGDRRVAEIIELTGDRLELRSTAPT